jgi:hypothetical protein
VQAFQSLYRGQSEDESERMNLFVETFRETRKKNAKGRYTNRKDFTTRCKTWMARQRKQVQGLKGTKDDKLFPYHDLLVEWLSLAFEVVCQGTPQQQFEKIKQFMLFFDKIMFEHAGLTAQASGYVHLEKQLKRLYLEVPLVADYVPAEQYQPLNPSFQRQLKNTTEGPKLSWFARFAVNAAIYASLFGTQHSFSLTSSRSSARRLQEFFLWVGGRKALFYFLIPCQSLCTF